MKNTGIRSIAQNLQAMGRNGDSILAHIMPEEAALLKRMGGAGTINPKTGLPEFYFGDISSYGGSSPGGSTSSGGGRDSSSSNQSPSYSGGGGSASWSGGGRDSSSSNQSPSYSGGGGGFNSANWGVGGGMLTPSTPSMSSVGGGGFAPTGGNNSDNYMRSLGVPTIIANTVGAVSNAAQNVGQSLLGFSDYTTGQYRQMMADPRGYLGGLLPTPSPQQAPTGPNIDPLTGRDYDREATQRAIRWGEAIGGGIASLRDMLSAPPETVSGPPGFRSEAAAGGYDFTPAAPQVPLQFDPGGSGRLVTPTERELFYEMQFERGNELYGRPATPMPEPRATESIQVPQAAPTPQGPPGFRSEAATGAYAITPVSLPGFRSEAALESLTAPVGPPGFRSEAALEPSAAAPQDTINLAGLPPGRFGTFDMQTAIQQYRQALGNIEVPTKVLGFTTMVNPAPYVNDPGNKEYYQTDEQIADTIMKNLPLAGLKVATDGSIVTTEDGMPSGEQMAQVAELAARSFTVPQDKMPPGSKGQMTLDPRQFVDIRPAPMPPERPAEESVFAGPPGFRSEAALEPAAPAGPPGFRSEVAQNVAQNLDREFERVTGSLVEGPATGPISAPAAPAPQSAFGNLPTFAQVSPETPRALPETSAQMQFEGQYQPPQATGLPTFIEAAGINAESTPAQISGALANMSTEQIYNVLDEAERMRRTLESTTGPFKVRENPAVIRGVDPRLVDITRKESLSLPAGQYYQFTSGVRPFDRGVHSTGRALDVAIMTADGQRLPNYQNPVFFSNYEQPALVGREIQKQIYPELNRNYVWGGYFSGDRSIYGALDLMDRRILDPTNPDINKGGRRPAGGSWETGLTKQQAAIWGLPAGVTQRVQTAGVTSPQATREAIQTRSLGNLLDYSLSASGLRSEVLTEGYNPPPSPRVSITGFREPLRALGYTDQEIDRFEGKADLPPETASAISGNLLEGGDRSRTGGDGGRDYDRPTRSSRDLPAETTPVEPVPVDYTTGFDLTRRTYTPSRSAETFSPAYP